jgi:hypothetical protein
LRAEICTHPFFFKKKNHVKSLFEIKKISNNIGINITQRNETRLAEKGRPPLRVITYEDNTKEPADEEKLSYLRETAGPQLIVAALITTVTFAACITMPGGFVQSGEDSGSALLRKSAAFKAFVITDTISMVFSSAAVFINLLIQFLIDRPHIKDNKNVLALFFLALGYIYIAMIAMVLAFVTGTYAVLAPSLDLAIPTTIIGLTFFYTFSSLNIIKY